MQLHSLSALSVEEVSITDTGSNPECGMEIIALSLWISAYRLFPGIEKKKKKCI